MFIIDYIISTGASVMMPLIFIVLGLILRLRISQAIKAGLMVGIGFIGLSITVNLMIDSLTPVSHAIVNRFGLNLTVLDMGWPAAAVAMGTRVGALVIPVCVALNVLMLYTKTTRILNVDIWNLWHHAFAGSLVAIITDNLWLGLFAAVLNCAITMVIADRTSKDVEKYLSLPGISVPHGFSASFFPAAWLVNFIPYVRDIKIDTEVIQRRLSVLGDPASLSAIIGGVLAIIAGVEVKAILQTAITMAAVMTIIPRMAKMLMEGVYPISERIQEIAQARAGSFGQISIGLDSAVSVGHPVTLSVSIVMIPIMLVMAAIIPGNEFLPFAFVLVTAVCRGDMFRTLLTGLLTLSLALLIGTNLAPLVTSTSFSLPNGASGISSVDYAGAMLPWAMIQGFKFKVVGVVVLTVITLLLADSLLADGLVKDSFLGGVLAREREYPTGIDMETHAIAIPHTEYEHVNKTGFAVAINRETGVAFQRTDDPEQQVKPAIVVLMAIDPTCEKVAIIQSLFALLADVDAVNKISEYSLAEIAKTFSQAITTR